jgi:hypothetical protein
MDIHGRIISDHILRDAAAKTYSWDTRNWPAGIYLFELLHDQRRHTQKIVVGNL